MKVIIAGSRNITDYSLVLEAILQSNFSISCVISGGAKGVDALGERFAKDAGIDLLVIPADWDKHSKAAGFIRNSEMAKIADGLIAIWDGKSKGTKHMIETARKHNLEVFIQQY